MKGVENFWGEMSTEDRTKLLKEKNCWQGLNIYLWEYLPSEIQIVIEAEFEKTRR